MVAVDMATELDMSQLYREVVDPLFDPLGQAPPVEYGRFLLQIYDVEDLDDPDFVIEALTDGFTSLPCEMDDLLDIARPMRLEDIARSSLTEVGKRTEKHVDDTMDRLPANIRPGKEFLGVCMIYGADAHAGDTRITGNRPYFEAHPVESAAIVHYVINTLRARGHEIDPTEQDVIEGVTLLHDIIEANLGEEDMYFDFKRNRNYNPLLLRRTLERIGGRFADFAVEGASSLEHITHVKSRPWMRKYQEDYIEGRVVQRLITSLAKAGEGWHNYHIEPHPTKDMSHRYEPMLDTLETAVVAHLEAKGGTWGHDFFEVLRTVEPEDIPALVADFKASIYDYEQPLDEAA